MGAKIDKLKCHRVINSRGEWTIETHVELTDGTKVVQPVPDGASKGEHEAVYVNVDKAIEIVEGPINDSLRGHDPLAQEEIDKLMLKMDGTSNKSNLGGNSILSVSLGVAQAAAKMQGQELHIYLAEKYGYDPQSVNFPTPVFNVLNGGKHAHNGLSFQEFMVIPAPNLGISKALSMGVDIYNLLRTKLETEGYETGVGDEGGFAPEGLDPVKALTIIREAVTEKYKPGLDVFFGMDVAAESFYDHDEYIISEQNLKLDAEGLSKYYAELFKKFEIIFLEDPFYEGDTKGWKDFFPHHEQRLMIVADDLVVTNPKFLKMAIKEKLANAVIVKPNQVGSLTETMDFIKMAKESHMAICVSHRSGDTGEDTFIADLAMAVNAEFIKAGAPARGERVVKYNRLLEIKENFDG